MRLILVLSVGLVVSACGSSRSEVLWDRIPADNLPIFLEETAHVPAWRDGPSVPQIRAESLLGILTPNLMRTDRGELPAALASDRLMAAKTWRPVSLRRSAAVASRTDPRCSSE